MRKLFLALAGVAAALLIVPVFAADDKKPADKPADKKDDTKEVKLEGTMVCGKCKLGKTDECSNAVQVKEGKETVTYYLKDKGAKEDYHGECCKKSVQVTVTGGKVTEKDGMKWLEGGKVEIKKDDKKGDK